MIELETFEYRHEDVILRGRLAMPEGPGPYPGVLVMKDALALNGVAERRCRDLAALGYAALATDMYGVGPGEPDAKSASEMFAALQQRPEYFRARVMATCEAVRALPQVDSRRMAAIGYCFGGQCVLELARSSLDVAAVVSFHGLLTTRLPARPGEVRAKILAITGALDPHAPLSDAETFRKEMDAAGADWQLTIYGQGMHAWTDAEVARRVDIPGLRYDPFLDRLSWAQATEFLDALLDP